jgi:choline kinase
MKVKAFITAAGMGKRFGFLTHRVNKSLMKVEGKPLVAHIVDKLQKSGIREIYVATGYQSHQLERCLANRAGCVFNPFYKVAGILGSFWEARFHLEGNAFIFTTSDHFFHPSVLKGCLKGGADIRVVVQKKQRYTKEDAKVILRGSEVVDLGKDLPVDGADGEFGGMACFSAKASALFFKELRSHFDKGELGGYMMGILKAIRQKHNLPIRYSLCGENTRIEVDSVHDLIAARSMAKSFDASRRAGLARPR